MSIATEITRLQGAKADLKTAIEGKGVTVSASALLDDYPDLVDAIQTGGGGDISIIYSRYTLTGDTTLKAFLDAINYEVTNNTCAIFMRASGDVVPSSGNYVLNNFIFLFITGSRIGGRDYYKNRNQNPSPNSFPNLPSTNENNTSTGLEDGILSFTASTTSTSCIGTTGDVVTIAEIPLAPDNGKMNGGAL